MKSTGEGESPPFDTSYQGGAQQTDHSDSVVDHYRLLCRATNRGAKALPLIPHNI